MKNQGHLPLQIYVSQLIRLFQQAISSRNPALFLYHHNARTPLFMAESIARLLNKIYNDKEIEKGLKVFKKLEDQLGKIEDYDDLVKQCSKSKLIKEEQLDYFTRKRDEGLEKLNKKLQKKDFYQEVFNELIKAFKINFNNGPLISKLDTQVKNQIKDAFELYSAHPKKFTDMESHVHELRRKLRWVSIYAESLQGLVVLKRDKHHYAWEKKFIFKKEMQSSYNKLITKKGLAQYIAFDEKAFYALNFVIGALGEIKDQGMTIEALAKSIKKTGKHAAHDATAQAIKQLQVKYTEEDLLKKAHALLESFFVTYKIHEKLAGIKF